MSSGLPLYETTSLLSGEGYQVQLNWQAGARV
jgi:septum formation protein